jgi:hypothetical protein
MRIIKRVEKDRCTENKKNERDRDRDVLGIEKNVINENGSSYNST